jgi:hypothetical protein
MTNKISYLAGAALALAVAAATPASADSFTSYTCDFTFTCVAGVATSGSNFDLTSSIGNVLSSGLRDTIVPTDSLTLAQITSLSANYDMVTGGFALGAPRFTITDDALNSAWVYWGTPLGGQTFSNPNANGTFADTGNLADLTSLDVRVYSDGFGGLDSGNTGRTWADFVNLVGSTFVSRVYLDLDGGTPNAPQEMLVSSFTVNSDVDTVQAVPEPLTLSLFGAGLAGAVVMVRRRAKKG